MSEKKLDLVAIADTKIQATLGVITDNLDGVKERLKKEFEPYMGKEISIDNLADAKRTRSDANKIFNAMESKRKSIKKEWNTPYLEWEKGYKDAIKYITDYLNEVDVKIKATEQKIVEEKFKKIELLINNRVIQENDQVKDFINTIDWFRDSSWSNKTCSLNKIEAQINATVDKIVQDLSILAREPDNYYGSMYDEYKKHGELGDSLALKDRLVLEEKRREELKAATKAKPIEEVIMPTIGVQSNLFDQDENKEVVEEEEIEEDTSVSLDNSNWEEVEEEIKQNTVVEPVVQPTMQEPVELGKPIQPELLYTGAKDYTNIEIGYLFKTDIATARYLKEMAVFLGAEYEVIGTPKIIGK